MSKKDEQLDKLFMKMASKKTSEENDVLVSMTFRHWVQYLQEEKEAIQR